MKNKILLIAMLCFTAFSFNVKAQAPGDIDQTFNPNDIGFNSGLGANNTIYSTALQSDGKIIIGGDFTLYNKVGSKRITRLNANGSLDVTFNPAEYGFGDGANNTVQSIVLQSDGKIIIGGLFTSYNGIGINRIARLNADGTLDATFNPGTGANGGVTATAIQSDGKIIIGGAFTTYNGTSRNRIARLNADGTLDVTFDIGIGADNIVNTTTIQSDGKIIIAGDFTSYNYNSRESIARLNADGSLDATFYNFDPTVERIQVVNTTALQGDGKIIIGGICLKDVASSNITKYHIARLNADGTLDAAFNLGILAGGTVNQIASTTLQSDGKIIIGGAFTTCNGTSRNHIARLNADGTLDATFNPGTGANKDVKTTAIQNDGNIIIAGDFTYYSGSINNSIVRLNSEGFIDVAFNPNNGANNTVLTTAIQNDGKIIIGGKFTSFNEIWANCIARLNTDGTLDANFKSALGANGFVYATSIQSDGKIIIGGDFTSYDGKGINRVARLNVDGMLDDTFNPGTGANGIVYSTAIQSDGKIIIGGAFTTYNGTARNYIARLNADGTLDATFNPGTGANKLVVTTAIQTDGKIIIGGAFNTYNGEVRSRIIRLNADGTLDPSFYAIVPGSNPIVWTTAIESDGKIIIGGDFSYPRVGIARLNIDGTLDTTFNTGTGAAYGRVLTTSIQSDGKIIIAGDFDQYNDISSRGIARLIGDGSLDTTFIPGTGVTLVQSTAIQSDGKIIIGGDFTSYNGTGRTRVARVIGCIPVANTGTITGAATVCQGQNAVTYTVSTIENATLYVWTLPTGAIGTSTTNSIAVDFGTSATSGDITVKGTNSCGDGAISTFAVTVNPLPSSAGTISGTAAVCPDQNSVTYTVPVIANAISYIWTLPSGATGTSTTNSITVNFGASATSGNITVKGTNSCGEGAISTFAVTVNLLPAAAGTITGSATVCQGEYSVTYNVSTIADATSYVWTLPSGATGSSTTNSITVDFGMSAFSGDITVKGTNTCGDGPTSTFAVTVNPLPASPIISASENVLHSNAPAGNQWYNQSGLISDATNQDYTVTVSGAYYTIVTLLGCSSNASNTLNVIINGIEVSENSKTIKVYPNPVSNELIIEIEGNQGKLNFEILNATGQQVFKGNLVEKTTVETTNFNPGVYIIKLENGKSFEFKKIVKN